MSQLRSASLVPVCCAVLLAACSSNSTPADGGSPDGGRSDGGSRDGGPDGGLVGDGGSPPGAPVLSFTTSQTGVQLTWTLPGAFGDERFQVLRSDQGGPFVQVTGAGSITADAYSDGLASALPGAGHSYEVTATNGNGTGPDSNIVTVLQAPGDVAAGGSDTKVILLWSPIQNAATYDVYRVPAPDAGGTSTKLGSTAQGEFLDDGSAAPITTGSTYAYQVIAQSVDGGQPSTGSNVATTSAFGLDVTLQVTHDSDLDGGAAVAENSLYNPAVLLDIDGGFTGYTALSISNASVIPNVPAGPYYLTTDYTYFTVTSARSIDLSFTAAGRANVVEPTNLSSETTMTYALTGLAAWADPNDGGPVDSLASVSHGAGNFVTDLQDAVATDAGIVSGAVSFNGVEAIDGTNDDVNLVDSTQGDVYYLTQLHLQHSGNGQLYQTIAKSYTNTSLHMADGSNSAISGAMAAVTPIAIADLQVKSSAFAAQGAAVNPAAVNAGQTVAIESEKDFTTYGYYGSPSTLLSASVDPSGNSNVDLGLAGYGNPFPASWQPFVYVTYGFNMNFDLTGDNGPATFEAVSGFYQPVSGFNFATGIAPTLAPMTNLQINGQSAFTDQTNVTLSPTISWTAPTSSTSPIIYFVSLYELSIADDGSTIIGNSMYGPPYYPLQDETFYTTATSFKFPPELLTAETTDASHWYFITVDAQVTLNGSTPVDQTLTPNQAGTSYQDVEIISNKFTPGAGTAPPSTYDLVHADGQRRPAVYRKAGLFPAAPVAGAAPGIAKAKL